MKVATIFNRYKITIENGKLFDPIRQLNVKATPEEIVRQKTIKFLIKRLMVPFDRIIVERSLGSFGLTGNDGRKRIDIGILDSEGLLMAVIECKASLAKGDEAASVQAQEYLLALNTRYFFVTDGMMFTGYYYDTEQFIRLETITTYDRWYEYPSAGM